jgi:hypothetical protein
MTRKMSRRKRKKTVYITIPISRIWMRALKKIRLTWKEKMKRMRTTKTSTRFETSTLPLTI